MYEIFYGLREKPFALTPDPDFLYLAPPHRKALTMLEYSLENDSAFCLISGEVGSGKTTLIRHLLKKISSTMTVGLLANTSPNFGRLLQWVSMSFGLEHAGKEDIALYEQLSNFVASQHSCGRRVLLIVDEAQNLGYAGLEDLRVLSNINTEKYLLLQTILVGQPELRSIICEPRLVQLAQRIGADYHIGALSEDEARRYVYHRLRIAGAKLNLFSHSAVTLAFRGSGGIPRLINQFCDRALVYGYADRRPRIDSELMAQVIEDRRSGGLVAS